MMSLDRLVNNLLTLAIVICFFILIYSQFRKQGIKETIEEIMSLFKGKEDDGRKFVRK